MRKVPGFSDQFKVDEIGNVFRSCDVSTQTTESDKAPTWEAPTAWLHNMFTDQNRVKKNSLHRRSCVTDWPREVQSGGLDCASVHMF